MSVLRVVYIDVYIARLVKRTRRSCLRAAMTWSNPSISETRGREGMARKVQIDRQIEIEIEVYVVNYRFG